MTFVSYAQNFEDVVLWRALHDVKDGHYLDIGAQDPVVDSVSLSFYQAGWRGTHVEPSPAYAAKLREARPDETTIEAAVTDAIGPIVFHEIPDTGLSTGKSEIAEHHSKSGFSSREIISPCVRLDSLLEMSGTEPHWLKIDVEGMEPDVLRSWGESLIRPWIVLVESTFPGTEEPTQLLWEQEVLGRGYCEVFFDGLSRYFLHESHRDRASYFHAPANVFDRFAITPQHFTAAVLREEITESAERANAQTAEVARLADELFAVTNQSEACKTETARLEKALETAAEQVRQHRVEIERAEESVRIATTQANDYQTEISRLNGELLIAADKAGSHNTEIARLNKEILTTTQDLLQERQAIELSLRASLDKDLVEARRSERHAAEAELRPKLAEAVARVEQLLTERSWIEEKSRLLVEAATNQTNHVQGELEKTERDYRSRLAQAEGQSEQLRAEVSGLRSRLEETERDYRSRLAQAEAQSQQLRAEIESLRSEREEAERDYSARLAQAEAQSEGLRSSADNAKSLIRHALAAKLSRWDRIGRMLRLSRTPMAWRDLAGWSVQSVAAGPAPSIVQPNREARLITPHGSTRESHNPYLRANSLAELLSWDDVDFVRCAYVTILGKQPDEQGEVHYTKNIRCGHSKLAMLWQLRRSAEGARHDPGIAGLDRALKKAAFGRIPIVGRVIRLFMDGEGDSARDRQFRAMENRRAVAQQGLSQGIQRFEAQLTQQRTELKEYRSDLERVSAAVVTLETEWREKQSAPENSLEIRLATERISPPSPYVVPPADKLLTRILRTASVEV